MAESFEQVPAGWGVNRGQLHIGADNQMEAPKNIIQTVTGARTLFYKWRFEHFKRIELYSRIEGLIAGNPPYNPQDLAKLGISHIANFNNMDGRSLFEKGSLAYWNLLNSTERLIDISLRLPPSDQSSQAAPELDQYAILIAKHWTDVVKEWPSFETHMCTLSGQLVKFGVSPVVFPDERDWQWRTVELSRFYVSDQAPTDTDLLTGICIESNFTAQYLWEVYDAVKGMSEAQLKANKIPWRPKELEGLLLFRANIFSKQDNTIITMMDLQMRLQNGDLGWDVIFSDEIRLVTMLYKEYDGSFTHYMFDRTYDQGQFLFKADNQYKSLDEAMVIFTASPSEFTIHSNRGLGHKIFAGCQATMQLDCDIVNMSRLGSTPLIRSISGLKDFEPVRIIPGVVNNIGNSEFAQNNLAANVQQLVGASQYLMNKITYNIANSGDDPAYPDASQGSISPTQAKIESYKEFGVLKNCVAHFYNKIDVVFLNMFLKMLHSKKGDPHYEYAQDWKERCKLDGVPDVFFQTGKTSRLGLPRQFAKVKASKVAGNGSTLGRIMGLNIVAPIVPGLSSQGIKNYQKEVVMAAFGPDHLNTFIGPDQPDESQGGSSLAAVENAVMQMGKAPVFSPDNEQRSHIVSHIALGTHTIQAVVQQQMTPVDANPVFELLVHHLMQEHIPFIAKDPLQKAFLDKIQKPAIQIQQYAILNKKNAEAMIQAQIKAQEKQQQQTQNALSDIEIKNKTADADIARKDRDAQTKNQRAAELSQSKTNLSQEKIRTDADNQRLKIQLEAQNKSQANQKSIPELRADLTSMNGITPAPADIE